MATTRKNTVDEATNRDFNSVKHIFMVFNLVLCDDYPVQRLCDVWLLTSKIWYIL